MKIIIPMAGRGSRLRPHTLTVPKPLIPIAGKPIVHRLVQDIAKVTGSDIDEVAFIIGDFGKSVEKQLMGIAESIGAKGSIYYQDEALGTAHAILCAKESLEGNLVVAFADTLFRTDFKIDRNSDGVIWVKQVEDPKAFGVVKMNENDVITDFVEKPETFVSDLAIIGIYYFKDGANLRSELQFLLDNEIKDKGEYQLTNALENMKQKGAKFVPGKVNDWMDCGNKDVTVETNSKILTYLFEEGYGLIDPSATAENAEIIPPCFIGKDVVLINSTIGPNVSVGNGCRIENSTVRNTLIQEDTVIENAELDNSMLGNKVHYRGDSKSVSIGDYSTLL